jgi:hypothetical protein
MLKSLVDFPAILLSGERVSVNPQFSQRSHSGGHPGLSSKGLFGYDDGMWRTHKRLFGIVCVAGLLFFYAVSLIASYSAGRLVENNVIYHGRFHEEAADMRSLLRSDSQFRDVKIEETSLGYAHLAGTVPSKAAYVRLKEGVERCFGQKRTRERMALVHVKAD